MYDDDYDNRLLLWQMDYCISNVLLFNKYVLFLNIVFVLLIVYAIKN